MTKQTLEPIDGNTTRYIVTPELRDVIDIGCTIYSITEVDPVTQTFACDMKIICRWHDATLEADPDMKCLCESGYFANGDGPAPKQKDGRFTGSVVKDLEPEMIARRRPMYEFGNAKETTPVEGTESCYLSNDWVEMGPGYVRWEQRYRGTFFEEMELQNFPWEVQGMHIIVRLAKRADAGRQLRQYVGRLDLKDWVKLSERTRYEPRAECAQDAKGRGRYVITIPP